jgi:predicted CoA-binding protein
MADKSAMIPTLDSAPDGIATRHDRYDDAHVRALLKATRTIALVGASANPARPSWIVLKYLLARGYDVTPVNPGLAGQDLLGKACVGSLADLSGPVDMVEIFRNSDAAGPLVDEALALPQPPRIIWMQLGVRNDAAAARAEEAGITVIMNRCPKIEYGRLSGEIGWTGVNSRIISAKKPVLAGRGVQRLTIDRP